MNKKKVLLSALLGLCLQSAGAAPIGLYNLVETWRDGSFSGQFFYDGSAANPVTRISGILTDSAQTTAIGTVWNGEKPEGASWVFVNNAPAGAPDNYDAGFYLNLIDLGNSLTLDTAADNGLYDWSRDFAFFHPEQLNGSPLLSFQISRVAVPEPASLSLMFAGLLAAVACRRKRAPA